MIGKFSKHRLGAGGMQPSSLYNDMLSLDKSFILPISSPLDLLNRNKLSHAMAKERIADLGINLCFDQQLYMT